MRDRVPSASNRGPSQRAKCFRYGLVCAVVLCAPNAVPQSSFDDLFKPESGAPAAAPEPTPSAAPASSTATEAPSVDSLPKPNPPNPNPGESAAAEAATERALETQTPTVQEPTGQASPGESGIDSLFNPDADAPVSTPAEPAAGDVAPDATQPESAASDSIDSLFNADADTPVDAQPAATEDVPQEGGVDALFETDAEPGTELADDAEASAEDTEQAAVSGISVSGFVQNELAYAYPSRSHFSKFKTTLQLAANGSLGSWARWTATGRLSVDPSFDKEAFFDSVVEEDQTFEGQIRDTYIDFALEPLDFRVGRQTVVWGETPGVFVADVVNAKDFRETIVQDFDLLRIPQWSMLAEYITDDAFVQALWIPFQTVDNIGEPGSEFYPWQAQQIDGVPVVVASERKPSVAPSNSGFGFRAGVLVEGWDLAAFYYTSIDQNAAFRRDIVANPTPVAILTPTHERIHQIGGTFTKDFSSFLLKGELVFNKGRNVETFSLADTDGLLSKDFVDYIIGVDWHGEDETNINVQFFQRWFPDHERGMIQDKFFSGITVFATTALFHPKVKPELLWVNAIDDDDWSLQAKIRWEADDDIDVVVGADIFEGGQFGPSGRYDNNDRVYYEVRYTF